MHRKAFSPSLRWISAVVCVAFTLTQIEIGWARMSDPAPVQTRASKLAPPSKMSDPIFQSVFQEKTRLLRPFGARNDNEIGAHHGDSRPIARRTFLTAVAAFFTSVLIFGQDPDEPTSQKRVEQEKEAADSIAWIAARIQPKTGLAQSYAGENEKNAYTYDQAVAIKALLAGGQTDAARTIGEGLLKLQEKDGAWRDAYLAADGTVVFSNKATGPNAWVVLAMADLYGATKDARFLESAERALAWILKYQDLDASHGTYGGMKLGEVPYPDSTSTEAGADTLAALSRLHSVTQRPQAKALYAERAKLLATWLTQKMWQADHFEVGCVDSAGTFWKADEYLDSQTWTLLALEASKGLTEIDPKGFNGLSWISKDQKTVDYSGKTLKGFAKKTKGAASFWSEGVAGYAGALRIFGKEGEAFGWIGEIEKAKGEDGGVLASIGPPGSEWHTDLRISGIAATAWYAFAKQGINPFAPVSQKPKGPTHKMIRMRSSAALTLALLDPTLWLWLLGGGVVGLGIWFAYRWWKAWMHPAARLARFLKTAKFGSVIALDLTDPLLESPELVRLLIESPREVAVRQKPGTQTYGFRVDDPDKTSSAFPREFEAFEFVGHTHPRESDSQAVYFLPGEDDIAREVNSHQVGKKRFILTEEGITWYALQDFDLATLPDKRLRDLIQFTSLNEDAAKDFRIAQDLYREFGIGLSFQAFPRSRVRLQGSAALTLALLDPAAWVCVLAAGAVVWVAWRIYRWVEKSRKEQRELEEAYLSKKFPSEKARTEVPGLIAILKAPESDADQRYGAVLALGLFGPEGREAIPALFEKLMDWFEAEKVRQGAAVALGEIADPSAIADLEKARQGAGNELGSHIDGAIREIRYRDYFKGKRGAITVRGLIASSAVTAALGALFLAPLFVPIPTYDPEGRATWSPLLGPGSAILYLIPISPLVIWAGVSSALFLITGAAVWMAQFLAKRGGVRGPDGKLRLIPPFQDAVEKTNSSGRIVNIGSGGALHVHKVRMSYLPLWMQWFIYRHEAAHDGGMKGEPTAYSAQAFYWPVLLWEGVRALVHRRQLARFKKMYQSIMVEIDKYIRDGTLSLSQNVVDFQTYQFLVLGSEFRGLPGVQEAVRAAVKELAKLDPEKLAAFRAHLKSSWGEVSAFVQEEGQLTDDVVAFYTAAFERLRPEFSGLWRVIDRVIDVEIERLQKIQKELKEAGGAGVVLPDEVQPMPEAQPPAAAPEEMKPGEKDVEDAA